MEQEQLCGIYKVTSPIGKIYIGQSKNIKNRFENYRQGNCKKQRKLYNSFYKHGHVNHVFEVIERCLEEDLNCRERYWQDFYDVRNEDIGLNSVLTSCNDLDEEDLTYKRKEKKGIRKGENHPNYNRKFSEFERFKMSLGKSKLSEEEKTKIIENFKDGDYEGKEVKKFNKTYVQGRGQYKNKIVLDLNTGVFYNSLKELCKLYGMNYNSIKQMLSGKNKNKTSFIYA